ncbi:MAG: ABC-type multidrug transport system ATPase subunit [Rhodoferax sp.]
MRPAGDCGLAAPAPQAGRDRSGFLTLIFHPQPELAIKPDVATPSAVVQIDGLSFSFPARELLRQWSAHIPVGVTWLRGAESSGKTTLLRLLGAELTASAGRLQIGRIRLDQSPQAYRSQVFWVDPRTEVFDQLSANDWFFSLPARYPDVDTALLRQLCTDLSLTPHLNKPLYMLSTGSKRKVWLAGACASGAQLTLLDEPFAALDKPSIDCLLAQLQAATQQPSRVWLIADHAAPATVALASTLDLGG